MPQAAQRRDVVLQDGPRTAAAFWSEHVKVIFPAVRLPVLLMKTCSGATQLLAYSQWTSHITEFPGGGVTFRAEERATLSTEEVFGMPRPIQRRHHFLKTHNNRKLGLTETARSADGADGADGGAVVATHIQDGAVAVEAPGREQVVIILLTVWQAVTLKEVPGSNLLLTVGAHKVFGVPRPAHGGHHLRAHTHAHTHTSLFV